MEFGNKKRNSILIVICFLVYGCSYFLKYSFNANIISIEQKFLIPHSETGLVSTLFFICYGLGQFINGFLVRKYNLKWVVPLSLLVSCGLNIALMLTPENSFYLVKYYWAINGLSLSLLWPCVVRFFVENVDSSYKDKGSFILGLVIGVGTFATYALSSLFTKINNFSLIFIVAASLGALAIFLWLFFFRKISSPNGPTIVKKEKVETTKADARFIVYLSLSILLCVVAVFGRDGFQNWGPSILNESYHFDVSSSVLVIVILPLCQFIGVTLATLLSKRIKSHIVLSIIFFFVAFLALGIGWLCRFQNVVLAIFVMGFTIISSAAVIHIICTMLPVAWSKDKNSGLFAGVFNGCSYIGSAAASYGLSVVADKSDWNNVFDIITLAFTIALSLALLYFLVRLIIRIRLKKSKVS